MRVFYKRLGVFFSCKFIPWFYAFDSFFLPRRIFLFGKLFIDLKNNITTLQSNIVFVFILLWRFSEIFVYFFNFGLLRIFSFSFFYFYFFFSSSFAQSVVMFTDVGIPTYLPIYLNITEPNVKSTLTFYENGSSSFMCFGTQERPEDIILYSAFFSI